MPTRRIVSIVHLRSLFFALRRGKAPSGSPVTLVRDRARGDEHHPDRSASRRTDVDPYSATVLMAAAFRRAVPAQHRLRPEQLPLRPGDRHLGSEAISASLRQRRSSASCFRACLFVHWRCSSAPWSLRRRQPAVTDRRPTRRSSSSLRPRPGRHRHRRRLPDLSFRTSPTTGCHARRSARDRHDAFVRGVALDI